MTQPSLTLSVLPGRFAVCRLDPAEQVPGWASSAGIFSIMRTPEELSIVCPEEVVPDGIAHEPGWRTLKLHGPFPFELVGVLASVLAPLAGAGVSIFALSTYDTDYVFVKEAQLADAVEALRGYGHRVHE